MAVNQDGLGFDIDDFFAINHEVSLGRHDLGFVGLGFEQLLFPILGGTLHVGLVRRFGTDGRNTDQTVEFFQETIPVGIDVIFNRCHRYLIVS